MAVPDEINSGMKTLPLGTRQEKHAFDLGEVPPTDFTCKSLQ